MSTFTSSPTLFKTRNTTSLTFVTHPTITSGGTFTTHRPRLCPVVHSRDANARRDEHGRDDGSVRMTTGERQRVRRKENVAGEFFVDSSCIDCDTCRWLCPSVFNRQNNQSAVFRQPVTDAERLHALRALVACPTNSIRTVPTTTTTTDSTPSTTKSQKPNAITAAKSFPLHYNNIPGVYYLGHASAHTFGAASWLLLRRDVVVMVDVPRYDANLASRIDALLKTHNRQAVDYILLTHCDDVAGHDAWAERLTGCQRIIHAADQSTAQGTDKCEVVLHDEDFELYDENVRRYCIGLGVYVLYVPGHTEGSLGVWDEETKTLFSGDHCWGGGGSGGIERESEEKWVTASDRFCFFDFDVQVENIAALRNLGVRNVLPGHGKPVMFGSEEEGRKAFAEAPGRIRGC